VIETDDLYLAALTLVRGGELAAVNVRGTNGRRLAVFSIEGERAEAAAREYHRGSTSVDLRLLKSEVRRLKDLAFGALRDEERRSRDAGIEGRDRAHQGGERPHRRSR
jgi:hypothetical protein